MTDLDIIKQLEQEIGIKLQKLEKIEGDSINIQLINIVILFY